MSASWQRWWLVLVLGAAGLAAGLGGAVLLTRSSGTPAPVTSPHGASRALVAGRTVPLSLAHHAAGTPVLYHRPQAAHTTTTNTTVTPTVTPAVAPAHSVPTTTHAAPPPRTTTARTTTTSPTFTDTAIP